MSSNAMSPKALFSSPTSFPLLLLSTQFVLQCSKNLIPHYTLLVTTCSMKVSCVFKQSHHPRIKKVLYPLPFDLCADTLGSLTSFHHLFCINSFSSSLSLSCLLCSTLLPHVHYTSKHMQKDMVT
jgi:hypothetical protein